MLENKKSGMLKYNCIKIGLVYKKENYNIMRQFIFPKKICAEENISNSKALFIKRFLQVDLFEEDLLTVENGGFIVLDFGKEMCGGVRILTSNAVNGGDYVKVRIRFGESLSETYAELGEKNATNHHAPRDMMQILPAYSDVLVGQTGFRFVRIDFPKNSTIGIKNIVAENNILRKPLKNGYKGNDKDIKKIFEVAKRTVDLCASGDYVWDGIKRDRLVWSGDLYPEILSLTYLYGRVKQLENSLDFERMRAKFNGKWISMITTYSMWWLACVSDYYFLTGEKEFVLRQLNYVKEVIAQFDECVEENGKMNYPEHFVDWATYGLKDQETGSRLISIFGVKKAIALLKEFNQDIAIAERLLNKLMNADFTVESQKQVIALKYFALGEISDEEYQRLIKDGAKGITTFMSYFVLTAIATRDKDLSIKLMKEYHLGMINKGATTFWEDFDIDWINNSSRIDRLPKKKEKDIHGDFGRYCYTGFRHSLCHAWSSGVIKFIAENCD